MEEHFEVTVGDQIAALTLSRAISLGLSGKHPIAAVARLLGQRDNVRALILTASDPTAFLVKVSELADLNGEAAAAFSRAGHDLAKP